MRFYGQRTVKTYTEYVVLCTFKKFVIVILSKYSINVNLFEFFIKRYAHFGFKIL